MTWLAVARREAVDVRRSRALWAVLGLFTVVGVAAAVVPAIVVGEALAADRALGFLVGPLKVVAAMTALLAGYGAIAGPRSGGQLKLALGLPIDRRSLVVGAFVGRAAVVLAGVGVGLAAIAAVLPLVYGEVPAASLVGFGALLALFAVSVTALAVGLSAACASRGRAAVAAVGAFVFFEFFWGVVPAAAHYVVAGSLPGAVVPAWVILVERLQPLAAFEAATELVLPTLDQAVQVSGAGAEPTEGPRTLADRLADDPPGYLDPWAAVVTLVGWIAAPLVVGWYRFSRADL